MEIELWKNIASAALPQWWIVALIGTVLVALIAGAFLSSAVVAARLGKGSAALRIAADFPFFVILAVGVTLIVGVVSIGGSLIAAKNVQRGEIEELVATYLHDELGMTPMSPVEYRTRFSSEVGQDAVHATVFQEDGTLAEVILMWHDVNSRPHNEAWGLPENANPISVRVVPLNCQGAC